MQFEVILRDSRDYAALRLAGIHPRNYSEIWYRAFCENAKLPLTTTCPYFLAEKPVDVRVTLLEFRRGAPHIQLEVCDETIARKLQKALSYYSTESSPGDLNPIGQDVRPRSVEILQRDGLTLGDIQDRTKQMPTRCVDALMRHYDETESAFRNDICWLFTRVSLSKQDQSRVARWLVNHLAVEKDPDSCDDIVTQLFNELAVPEIADDLIRLLKDQSFKARDGCLFDVFAKTKDRRVLEVAVSVLDDKELTQRALATIGRRKAKQHIEKVRKFLDHPNFEIRKEAKKTMKQLGFPVETPPTPVHLTRKSAIPKKLEEWSANLDAEEVSPILEKLTKRVERGFGAKEIAEVNGVLEDMKEEQTKTFRFPIVAEGKKTELWLVVFMDDVDSPDLEIHSSPELIQKLDRRLADK